MSVVALVIAPSIALDDDAVTSYITNQSENQQTVQLVISDAEDNTEKKIQVQVSSTSEQNEMTVQVNADQKKNLELHQHQEANSNEKE